MQPGSEPIVTDSSISAIPHRLHPLTPLVLGLRSLVLIAILALSFLDQSASSSTPTGSGLSATGLADVIIFAVVTVLLVLRGIISVAVTRFGIESGELRVDSGLIRRQSKRVRLDRVQSVDLSRPLAARAFGLAALKVTTAGTERSAITLRYLGDNAAEALRRDWLERAHGTRHPTEIDPFSPSAAEGATLWPGGPDLVPERPLARVPPGALVGSSLLELVSTRGLLIVAFVAVPIITASASGSSSARSAAYGSLIFVLYALHGVWRRVSGWWDFTVAETEVGLRVHHGLLTTSTQTIPIDRIQAVDIHQPFVWRLFDWVIVKINVAGYVGDRQRASTVMLPVAPRSFALRMVADVLRTGGIDHLPLARPPKRSAWVSPLRWRAMAMGSDERIFATAHGLLGRHLEVVPYGRIQSLRISAGPWQRLLHLASVHADSTRGPVRITAAHRDRREARVILDTLVERSRDARSTHPPPAPAMMGR